MKNLIILVLLSLWLWSHLKHDEKTQVLEWAEQYIPDEYLVFLKGQDSTRVTFALLKKYGIKFDTIVMCQHIQETGWDGHKSDIFLSGHNCFGMKDNNRGYNDGTYKGHANYANIEASVQDYAHWQRIRMQAYEDRTGTKIKTNEDYYKFLENLFIVNGKKASYAEWSDTNHNGKYDYAEHLKTIYTRIKMYK